MRTVEDRRIWRGAAHWVAVAAGLVLGVVLFESGLRGLFVLNSNDTLLDIIALLAGTLTLLPLSILAIFRPRTAAYGVLAALALFLVGIFRLPSGVAENRKVNLLGLGLVILVPSALAGLLLWAVADDGKMASGAGGDRGHLDLSEERLGSSSMGVWRRKLVGSLTAIDRRKQARWAAVTLGTFAGAWQFRLGLSSVARSIRAGDWVGVFGIGSTVATLLPLSIFAIFKPRLAAYGAVLSLIAALAYPIIVFEPRQYRIGDVLVGLFSCLLPDLPLAAVAALLIYAFRAQTGQRG